MSEHLVEREINGYRRNALSPSDLRRVDDHLGDCDACRRLLGDDETLSAAFAAVRLELAGGEAPEHILSPQLEAYVDGSLPPVDREIVESHLDLCPQCA